MINTGSIFTKTILFVCIQMKALTGIDNPCWIFSLLKDNKAFNPFMFCMEDCVWIMLISPAV